MSLGFGAPAASAYCGRKVWTNANGDLVKYNLAFLLPHLFAQDHGRILGYDNAHGVHERHDRGVTEIARYRDYQSTAARFYREVARIRRSYETESL